MYLNDSYISLKRKIINSKSVPSDVKSYYEFFTFFSLHQLIKVPTRITCNSATIIDFILGSYPERVTEQGIIDVGLSDHQLIFCARKNSSTKRGTHKHIKFCSFKHYSVDLFKETLASINCSCYYGSFDVEYVEDISFHDLNS